MTATKKLSRCPTDTLNHTPLKVLILSKMYRHDFNYIRASLLTGNGLSEATTPYNDKCSYQEGVKVGRPTLYIGHPPK